jgi:hypothetical protein
MYLILFNTWYYFLSLCKKTILFEPVDEEFEKRLCNKAVIIVTLSGA